MKGNTMKVVRINLFAGIFLLLAGIYLFFMNTAYIMSIILVLTGLFFLTRALAQYQELSDISG